MLQAIWSLPCWPSICPSFLAFPRACVLTVPFPLILQTFHLIVLPTVPQSFQLFVMMAFQFFFLVFFLLHVIVLSFPLCGVLSFHLPAFEIFHLHSPNMTFQMYLLMSFHLSVICVLPSVCLLFLPFNHIVVYSSISWTGWPPFPGQTRQTTLYSYLRSRPLALRWQQSLLHYTPKS